MARAASAVARAASTVARAARRFPATGWLGHEFRNRCPPTPDSHRPTPSYWRRAVRAHGTARRSPSTALYSQSRPSFDQDPEPVA
ncbi:hypothetical protein STENM327S_01561 [Streptomyces tendae]